VVRRSRVDGDAAGRTASARPPPVDEIGNGVAAS